MTSTTERARDPSIFFSNLPLYDTTSFWGGELLEKYGHDTHLRIIRKNQDTPYEPPRILSEYIPETSWWRLHAKIIREQLFQDDKFLCHPKRLSILCEWAKETMKYAEQGLPSQLVRIFRDRNRASTYRAPPVIPGAGHQIRLHLPTNKSQQHFDAILYSSLCIELCSYGIRQEYTAAKSILHLASECCKLALPTLSDARELNSSTFANTAIQSACDAGIYFEQSLAERYDQVLTQKRIAIERKGEQQRVRSARAKQASDQLWSNYNRRTKAATTIQLWQRRTLMRQYFHRRQQQRTKLRTLCRGASTHATHIKASHPPIPTSKFVPLSQPSSTHQVHNRPPSKHPFRHRGLSLPKRKRRQRTRRPRNRPPRYVRRDQVLPSSMPSSLPPIKSQGTVDSVPPKSPTEDHLGLPLTPSWPTESTPVYHTPAPPTTVSNTADTNTTSDTPSCGTSISQSSTSNKGESFNFRARWDEYVRRSEECIEANRRLIAGHVQEMQRIEKLDTQQLLLMG